MAYNGYKKKISVSVQKKTFKHKQTLNRIFKIKDFLLKKQIITLIKTLCVSKIEDISFRKNLLDG